MALTAMEPDKKLPDQKVQHRTEKAIVSVGGEGWAEAEAAGNGG